MNQDKINVDKLNATSTRREFLATSRRSWRLPQALQEYQQGRLRPSQRPAVEIYPIVPARPGRAASSSTPTLASTTPWRFFSRCARPS